MRCANVLLVGVLWLTSVAVSAAAMPTVQQIVDRFVEEIGGREEILKRRSMRVMGTWEVQGMSGEFELLRAAPNKQLLRIELGATGDILNGYDGKVAWTKSPMTGARLPEGAEASQAAEEADFYGTLHDARKYKSTKCLGRKEFDGRGCYEVRLVTLSGREITEYYDVENGLLAGTRTLQISPGGKSEVVVKFKEYRRWKQLLHATRVEVEAVSGTQTLVVKSVQYDSVPSSAFELPPDVRALVK